MHRSSVDLPEPEGPHRTIFSPARTAKLMSFNALNEPNHFSTPSISIIRGPSRSPFVPRLVTTLSLLKRRQLATKGTPSMLSGNAAGRGRFIHFSWIFARSPLAFILSMKALIDALISFS